VRDAADTDDLIQETVLRTLKQIEGFEPRREGALQAYLRQGVLNGIRDAYRRAARRPLATALPDELLAQGGASPLDEIIGQEAVERYEAALNQLKPSEREAVIARIELGCTYEEIAEALDKPSPGAARVAVARAMVRLAKEMGRAG
jgi:RNA polymerase sigma-70 factor (ECF subfamily)